MTGTMRAVDIAAVGAPLRLVERPIPEPGPGEVRVRVEACGVCGSDVFLQKGGFGDAVPFPVIPGHEAAGIVDALGPDVDRVGVGGDGDGAAIAVGDQVALYYISTPPDDPWAATATHRAKPRGT